MPESEKSLKSSETGDLSKSKELLEKEYGVFDDFLVVAGYGRPDFLLSPLFRGFSHYTSALVIQSRMDRAASDTSIDFDSEQTKFSKLQEKIKKKLREEPRYKVGRERLDFYFKNIRLAESKVLREPDAEQRAKLVTQNMATQLDLRRSLMLHSQPLPLQPKS